MTTHTLTLPLTKNDSNNYIDANSVTIEVNDENIKNIIEAIKSMPEAANNMRISLVGSIDWKKDGEDTDDRIDYEEMIVFKDGDLYIVGTEKYNSEEIESNSFRIDEVDDFINGFTDSEEEMHCTMCLYETTSNEDGNCSQCGSCRDQALVEKHEENKSLASENKNMANALTSLGFTKQEMDDICNGSLTPTQKPVAILISEDDVIARVLASYFVNEKIVFEDDKIKVEDVTSLTAWEPFEDYPLDWLEKQIKLDIKSTLDWLKSFNVSKHGERLISSSDANIGVLISKDEGTSFKLVDSSDESVSCCPSCDSSNVSFDTNLPEPEGDNIFRTHSCNDCDAEFEERYDLAIIELKNSNANNVTLNTYSNSKGAKLADKLIEESEIVFDTPTYTVHVYSSSNGFDIDVYPLGTKYDEDSEFEVENVDGGIIQDGDALDAIVYAFEFMHINEV